MKNEETRLLHDIEAFCKRHKISESYFGHIAVGAWDLVARLRDGHTIRLSTYQKVREFLSSDWKRKNRKKSADQAERTA